MRRDALIVPFDGNDELVIATDNSGSIGKKALDDVQVPYDVVAYFAFRVAYMECASVGGNPFSVILQNFNGDKVWNVLVRGIERGIAELGIEALPITGSTESNFSMQQSATGITVLGKRFHHRESGDKPLGELSAAIIGYPLVGDEVMQKKEQIAPLHLFQWCCHQEAVAAVVPVGSKGSLYELRQLFIDQSLTFTSEIDLNKTSGPATCFVVIYLRTFQNTIASKAGALFHKVEIAGGG
ncbi:ATP-binding protein [Virgibacillus ihumii]|uniref:ATP-binding protein n=1 Tax=Virgibacillus ihumii TaxID=2686091 RepID=UPI00157CA3DE|nr:ATP-binding protein [Virgibacillus ihumii]